MTIAAVTGASGGIGLECAKLLANKGAKVYCLSRSEPSDERLVHIKTDVSDHKSVEAAFCAIKDADGRLDILISNAGMGISGPVETTSPEDAKRQMDVNFMGFFNCVRCAVPLMREQGGSIVATSSVAAVFAIPFQAFYSASKAAINTLVLALRNELEPFGIRVSAVMPGDVKTGFTANRVKSTGNGLYGETVERSVATMEHDEQNGMTPERIARKIVNTAMKKNPKPISAVGFWYKLACVAKGVLPVRFQNFVVKKMYIK